MSLSPSRPAETACRLVDAPPLETSPDLAKNGPGQQGGRPGPKFTGRKVPHVGTIPM